MRVQVQLALLIIACSINQIVNKNIISKVLGKTEKTLDKVLKKVDFTKKYLKNYGYVARFSSQTEEEAFSYNLKLMQKFAGIAVSGEVDAATIKLMETPRCGLSDPVLKVTRRKRRFVLHGTKWNKNTLTWYLNNTSRLLKKSEVIPVLIEAFDKWQAVANINFIRKDDPADVDIDVSFGTFNHGDFFPFDGQGGTLAHAFYPGVNRGLNGDVHFDDSEEFTIGTSQGRNLLWVATHEIGHSLGLQHSNIREALMYPWYTGFKETVLTNDDIAGLQQLYGRRENVRTTTTTTKTTTTTTTTTTTPTTTTTTTTTPTTTTTTTTTPTTTTTTTPTTTTTTTPTTTTTTTTPTTTTTTPSTTTTTPTTTTIKPTVGCPSSAVTARFYNPITKLDIIVTKKQKVFTISREGVITSGPFEVKDYFPFISNDDEEEIVTYYRGYRIKQKRKSLLTAAFGTDRLTGKTHYTVLFVGEWFYVTETALLGSANSKAKKYSLHNRNNPLRIGFDWRVKSIDAAMTWQKNGRIYLFSGYRYWRYNIRTKRFDRGYPRYIRYNFKRLPSQIDSAHSSDVTKETYFTSGNRLYKFSDRYLIVERGYPKNVYSNLFKCKGKDNGNKHGNEKHGSEKWKHWLRKVLGAKQYILNLKKNIL